MGRQDNDALAGKFREQVLKADPFFGIESGSRLVDDEQLRIIKQSLRRCRCAASSLQNRCPAGAFGRRPD
jgi:hypothetical protein